jgi:hypothetical protein
MSNACRRATTCERSREWSRRARGQSGSSGQPRARSTPALTPEQVVTIGRRLVSGGRLKRKMTRGPLPRWTRGQALRPDAPANGSSGARASAVRNGHVCGLHATGSATGGDGRTHTHGIRTITPPVITGPQSTAAKGLHRTIPEHLRMPPQSCPSTGSTTSPPACQESQVRTAHPRGWAPATYSSRAL